jgi:hypothetical protein
MKRYLPFRPRAGAWLDNLPRPTPRNCGESEPGVKFPVYIYNIIVYTCKPQQED